MTPENRQARIAGLLYLLVAVTGGFSELYVRARARVPGDAAATADDVSASATLFRVGALPDMVSVACFLLLALVLYRLLKPVGANAALAMLVLNAVSVAAMTANLPNHLWLLARGVALRRPPDQVPAPIEHSFVNQARRTR